MLKSNVFQAFHKKNVTDFTRDRKLTFRIMILLILQKTMKSLQLRLNEFFGKLQAKFLTASASAFTQARSKLYYTAFIELNQKAIVEPVYSEEYKTYLDFRLLAVDGSQVILPNEENIVNHFGSIKIRNQIEDVQSQYPVSKVSVLYDVLNKIGIDAIMGHSKAYEVDLAIEHLDAIEQNNLRRENDLLIFDRGYPSYVLLATLIKRRYHFVARCSRGSFKAAQLMFGSRVTSQIVTLKPPSNQKSKVRDLELPEEIQIRLVRVVLNSGEIEVLATSLLDKTQCPSRIFKEIYNLRWGIEGFYDILKNRLNLENFSGRTADSVKQDFFSTILITGLESILTEDAQEILDSRSSCNQNPQNVNKAVSFNTIKNHVIQLLHEENDLDILLDKLTKLFLTKTISVQNHDRPRIKKNPLQILNFYKRKKKIVF